MIAFIILLPFFGAFAGYMAGYRKSLLRYPLVCAVTCAEFLAALWIFIEVNFLSKELFWAVPEVCALGLNFHMDAFRSLYALISAFMWLITTLFSGEYFRSGKNMGRYYFFTLITLGATVGLFCSDDMYTTFIFFEVMSMASYPWVAHSQSRPALKAGATYIGISILGGMVSLMGLFLIYNKIGTLSFAGIRAASGDPSLTVPGLLTIFGFAVKAGAFPVHVWLPKAHPVAPAPSSALLSGILTKTGMFGILAICLNLFLGDRAVGNLLLAVALSTMLLGALLAIFSTDLKRVLACSSMSQIGYILTGVSCAVLLGEEGSMAAAGAVAHMINHSLLKLTLFLCAGCVHMDLHKLELNDIRGFGRGKKLLNFCFLMGALGLSGVPLFNGYVSKTLIHESIVELGGAYRIPEWIFLFAAGLTAGYMLKLYIVLFVQKNKDETLQREYDAMNGTYMNRLSSAALTFSAVFHPLLGLFAGYTLLPMARKCAAFLNLAPLGSIRLYSLTNLTGGGITLIIGTLAYLFVVRRWMYSEEKGYINRWPKWLDLEDSFYRPVLCRGLSEVLYKISFVFDRLVEGRVVSVWIAGFLSKACAVFDRLVEGRVVSVWIAGFLSKACAVFDRVTDGKFVKEFLADFFVAIMRVFDEMTDHIALLIDELFFNTRKAMRRTQKNSIFIRMACVCADGALLGYRMLSHKPEDERSITDMRYGTFVTNAISFGLLLCAVAILAAVIYVFVHI